MNFAISLEPDQAHQNVGSDLDLSCFDTVMVFLKDFLTKFILEKISRQSKMHAKLPSMQRVDMPKNK